MNEDESTLPELQAPPTYNDGPPPSPPSPQAIAEQPLRAPQQPHFPSRPELRLPSNTSSTNDTSMHIPVQPTIEPSADLTHYKNHKPHSTAPTPELPQSDTPAPQEVTIEERARSLA